MTVNHKKSYMINREDEFMSYIVPYLKKHHSGEWISCEGTGNYDKIETIEQYMDLYCGIDALYLNTKKQLKPFAIRVQKYGNKDWGTFTIRAARDNSNAKTEYTELDENIKDGDCLRPIYHLQAYLSDNNEVIAVYMIKTKDLIDFINFGGAELKHTSSNQNGQSSFYVCKVDKLIRSGYKVEVLKPKREIELNALGDVNPMYDRIMKEKPINK